MALLLHNFPLRGRKVFFFPNLNEHAFLFVFSEKWHQRPQKSPAGAFQGSGPESRRAPWFASLQEGARQEQSTAARVSLQR